MIKLLNFMKKYKVFMIVLSILLFAIPLIVVQLLYKMDCGIVWLQSEWTAGDVLAYIAGFEAFVGTVSLGFLALWQNQQIHEQHIESLEPLLSMHLLEEKSILYLVVENTGGVEAKNIRIKVLNLCNNGSNNDLWLDGLFDTVFELYPKEKVRGRIAICGSDIATEIFPQIKIKVSYIRPDLKREKEYERTVIYNNGFSQSKIVNTNTENEKIASDVDKIARANIRIANYLDGRQITQFDEINISTNSSLKNDLVEAIKTKKETPICDRTQTTNESLKSKRQEEK
ncbi:MAG: hypothetical protein ACI4KD_03950 [Oscillospiraceae bacterium]